MGQTTRRGTIISRLPGLGGLAEIEPSRLVRPRRELVVTLIFLFAPQFLALVVFLVRRHGKDSAQVLADLHALFSSQFGHGELFVYSIASLAPIFIILTRDRSLVQRTSLTAYFSFTAVAAAVLLMAQQPAGQLSARPYFLMSVFIFVVTFVIVYAAHAFDERDPLEEVAKGLESTNGDVGNLRNAVDEIIRNDEGDAQ